MKPIPTIHEYEFLKGNEEYWPSWGAAFAAVTDFCQEFGWGGFGRPTERGKKAMEVYEQTLE